MFKNKSNGYISFRMEVIFLTEKKEIYTTVLEGQILQPGYKDNGERVNYLADTQVKVMGTATVIDLLLIVIAIYKYIEEYYLLPEEKTKAGVEQIQRLLEEIKQDENIQLDTP